MILKNDGITTTYFLCHSTTSKSCDGGPDNCLFQQLTVESMLFSLSCERISNHLLSDSADVRMLSTQLDIPDDRQAPKIIYSNLN